MGSRFQLRVEPIGKLPNNHMTRYYMHEGPTAFRFELAGDLDATDAASLAQDWHTASSLVGKRTLIIDVTFVTEIDEAVRTLFGRWYARGAEFAAGSSAHASLSNRSRNSRSHTNCRTHRRIDPAFSSNECQMVNTSSGNSRNAQRCSDPINIAQLRSRRREVPVSNDCSPDV